MALAQRNPSQPDASTSGCRIDTGKGFKPVTVEEFGRAWRRVVTLRTARSLGGGKSGRGGNPRPRERTAPRSRPKGRARSRPRAQARDGPDPPESEPPKHCAACGEPLGPERTARARYCPGGRCRKAAERQRKGHHHHHHHHVRAAGSLPAAEQAQWTERAEAGYRAVLGGACPFWTLQTVLTATLEDVPPVPDRRTVLV